MKRLGLRPPPRWGLGVAALVLLIAGAVAFVVLRAPGDVSNPNLSFTRPAAPRPRGPAAKAAPFEWPRYGFDAARTRFFSARGLSPPLRTGWRFNDGALLEFPPVIYANTLYLIDDNGSAKALDKHTGRLLWTHQVGTLAAASPALGVSQGLVYFPLLSRNANAGQNPGNGRFVALSMRDGRVRWSRPIPSGTESSPLAWKNTVYFGDQSGKVYALRADNGRVRWTYQASAAVKGGPALVDGVIYFGDYGGRAYAVNARTGREVWAVSTAGARFGLGSGEFYASPAVAFGRVYLGNTDGRVYSFAARTGQLAWATGTGAYVYASAAVADPRGLGPTVYVGSYDGNMYAFDARSGGIRWRHAAGGKISGAGTIVNGILYFSDLGNRDSAGLDVRTGRQMFSFPDGAFNPVIADYDAIYLSGYGTLYQMLPRRAGGASGGGGKSRGGATQPGSRR